MFAAVVGCLFYNMAGKLVDKYPAYIMITISFITRSVSLSLLFLVENPESMLTYAVATLVQVATLFQNVSVESVFMKHLPKEIRGVMIGMF